MSHAADSDDKWSELASKFRSLAEGPGGLQLRASSVYQKDGSNDVAEWFVEDAISDALRERFELLGVEASRAFGGVPSGAGLLALWLHRLYQYLCDQKSPYKRAFNTSLLNWDGMTLSVEGPAIERVCESSEAFCLSLRRQAFERQATGKPLERLFNSWIGENSSEPQFMYPSSACSIRGSVSFVAKCAETSIPIDFLSARLNVVRVPASPAKFESLQAYFDHIASMEGLIWGITVRGLWMALELPKDGDYLDSNGQNIGKTPFRWVEIDVISTEKLSQLESLLRRKVAKQLRPYPKDAGERRRFLLMLADEADDWIESADRSFGECLTSIKRAWSYDTANLIWSYGLDDFICKQIRDLLLLCCGMDDEKKKLLAYRPYKNYPTPTDVLDAQTRSREVNHIVEKLTKSWQEKLSQRAASDPNSWLAKLQKTLHEMDPKKYPVSAPIPLAQAPAAVQLSEHAYSGQDSEEATLVDRYTDREDPYNCFGGSSRLGVGPSRGRG